MSGRRRSRARAELVAGRLATALGDLDAAAAWAAAGAARAAAAGSAPDLADAHCLLGNVARGRGDQAAARGRYEEALARYRALGDRSQVGYTLVQLAKLGDLGAVDRPGDPADLDLAIARGTEALRLYRELGNTPGQARALHQLGYLTYKTGDYPRAAALEREALALRWADGNLTEAATSLEDLADIAGMTGHPRTAARLYGAMEVLREVRGVPIWNAYRDEYEREVAVSRQASPPDAFAAAWAEGRALPVADAVAEALTVTGEPAAAAVPSPAVPAPPVPHGLTPRELEVLRLFAAGRSNRAIADALCVGERTAKSHVASILAKLGVDSRTAAVAHAHRRGLV